MTDPHRANQAEAGCTEAEEVRRRLDNLCKPPGSLGVLEHVAARLCEVQQSLCPVTHPRHATVFAADHGVTCEGVTAWPSEVSRAVIKVMQGGRTASGVFAKSLDCGYEVVDVGLLRPVEVRNSRFFDKANRRGTGNLLREPAMSSADFDHAWKVGIEHAQLAFAAGNKVLIGGEMGIGNTTAATCLIGLLCDAEIHSDMGAIVGRGAGLNDQQLSRKQQVIESAVERVRLLGIDDPRQIACQVGGLEIVALSGFYHAAAQYGCTVLVDGLIATSAAVLADSLYPGTRHQMIAGHRSTEPAHAAALVKLQLTPILDLQMCLGEATGALTALPMLDLAAAMFNEMATLSELEL